jgi:hypothetical protein
MNHVKKLSYHLLAYFFGADISLECLHKVMGRCIFRHLNQNRMAFQCLFKARL